jgi:hypothetical protein
MDVVSPRAQQKDDRYRRRIEVRYSAPGQPDQMGYSANISRTGMMIRTPRVLAPGTVLQLELKFPQGTVAVRGRVVWARTGPLQWLNSGRLGMGVKFVDPPADLIAIVTGKTPENP